MNSEEKVERVFSVPYWRQEIPVGSFSTPGRSKAEKWPRFKLGNLEGQRVLDVGSWDGLHAFLAEEAGAEEVIAIDVYNKRGDYGNWWESIRDGAADMGIQTAKELRESNIEVRDLSVYDLSSEDVGKFDTVLFPAVFYHLQKPMQALESLAGVTRGRLVVETSTRPIGSGMTLDATDGPPFWIPDVETLQDMLSVVGFESSQIVSEDFRVFNPDRAVIEKNAVLKRGGETIQIEDTKIAIHLASGDDLPTSMYEGKEYVEINTADGPAQGWIESTHASISSWKIAREKGVGRVVKDKLFDHIVRGTFGDSGRHLAGTNKWVVVHAER